jgi:hypothetical protein
VPVARSSTLLVLLCVAGCYDFGRLSRLTDLAGTDAHATSADLAPSLCTMVGLPDGNLLPVSFADPSQMNGNSWLGGLVTTDAGMLDSTVRQELPEGCISPSSIRFCGSVPGAFPSIAATPPGARPPGGTYLIEAWVRVPAPTQYKLTLHSVTIPGVTNETSTSADWQLLAATTTIPDNTMIEITLYLGSRDGSPSGSGACFDLDAAWFGAAP